MRAYETSLASEKGPAPTTDKYAPALHAISVAFRMPKKVGLCKVPANSSTGSHVSRFFHQEVSHR